MTDEHEHDIATADTEPPPAAGGAEDVPSWLRWSPRGRSPAISRAVLAMHTAATGAGVEHHAACDVTGNVAMLVGYDIECGLEPDVRGIAVESCSRRGLAPHIADLIVAAWTANFFA